MGHYTGFHSRSSCSWTWSCNLKGQPLNSGFMQLCAHVKLMSDRVWEMVHAFFSLRAHADRDRGSTEISR